MVDAAVLQGLIPDDVPERFSSQACLLSFLNNKHPSDKRWGSGEVGALLKMRADRCSWEQIRIVLGHSHSVEQMKFKHLLASEMLKEEGYDAARYGYHWAAQYNRVNGLHIPGLTTGDLSLGEEPQPGLDAKVDMADGDIDPPYDDLNGFISVGAPTPSLLALMQRMSTSGEQPSSEPGPAWDVAFQDQAEHSSQGANGGPSGSNESAAAAGNQASARSLGAVLDLKDILAKSDEIREELRHTTAQLSDILERNTQFRESNTQLRESNTQLLEANALLRKILEQSTELLDNSSARLGDSSRLLTKGRNTIQSLLALVLRLAHHFNDDISQDDAAVTPAITPAMNPAQMMTVPAHLQGNPGPQPHPVEAMYMARIAAKRWQESPWSQGGTLPPPVNLPAPNLSIDEMLELQELVREYDTALHGEDTQNHGRGDQGEETKKHGKKTAKDDKTSRKRDRKGKNKKEVTIAASDSSSGGSSSDPDTDDAPSTLASAPRRATTTAHQQSSSSSSAHYYYEHVLARQFPPRRALAADAAWSASDCRILAVLEARYDALRYEQYQADFFNATGRMVPAYLIRAKMDPDAAAAGPPSLSPSSSSATAAVDTD